MHVKCRQNASDNHPLTVFCPLAPSPAQNVIVSVNNTHIIITWAAPATPNGIVNYIVEVQERDLLYDDTVTITIQEVTQLTLILGYSVMPYSEYTVIVTSQTSAGMGRSAPGTLVTPEEGTVCFTCTFWALH